MMNSIKSKLILIGLLAGLVSCILAAVNVYSVNQGTHALATVYENQVVPAAALKDMDRHLKEIRFRMAGVILEQLPGAGSKIQMGEAQADLPKQWATFKEQSRGSTLSAEAIEQIAIIDKNLALLPAFFEKLGPAYSSEDKAALGSLLESEWPTFQGGLLKPIGKLVAMQDVMVKETYDKSLAQGKQLTFTGMAVLGASLLILIIGITMISTNLHKGIVVLNDTLAKVAQGDLTVTVPFKRTDELGEMAQSLENTTAHLRTIVDGVKKAADKAASASESLSGQLEQVVARGASRNERVMHVAAAMEEISVSNSEVASSANIAGEAVHRNEEYARQGDDNMNKNRAAMEKVVHTAQNSVKIVSNLSDSIQKIGQITVVIKEIADQTNLLALNAAIEAARAGEQGRGFAVVADEVRKLAERTSSSTSEIAGVVDGIRNETEAAVVSMSEVEREIHESASFNHLTGEALRQIVEAANQVTGLVSSIAGSTREQTAATEEVARNMEEISALTEENSANIRQVANAAEDVSHIATELQHLVGQFKV